MLATGNSAVHAVDVLNRHGVADDQIRFMALVSAPEGVRVFHDAHPEVKVYTAALDSHLTDDATSFPAWVTRATDCSGRSSVRSRSSLPFLKPALQGDPDLRAGGISRVSLRPGTVSLFMADLPCRPSCGAGRIAGRIVHAPVIMTTVSMVHEQVHQRTGQQQQIGKQAEDMGPVPGEEEKGRHRGEAKQHDPASGFPPGGLPIPIVHGGLLLLPALHRTHHRPGHEVIGRLLLLRIQGGI